MAKFIEDAQPLHADYPLPDLDDPVMRPFWDGARQGKLMLQRDQRTGEYHWPPKPHYWKGERLQWVESSGSGTVYTYVVGYEPFLPAFKHLLPLVMLVVQLDEGPRLVGYLVHGTPEEVSFGMRVRVVFKRLTETVTLPVWEPDRGPQP